MEDIDNIYDMIIIGAGPAGLSAGIYGSRAKFKVLIIEKAEIGGQIRITSEVVNYPGISKTSGSTLTESMRKQAVNFGSELLNATVLDVDFDQDIKVIQTDKGEFKTFGVIIATGANPRMIGFKGEEEFKGRGVAYCATCDGEFFTGLQVFVVGAGYAAAEEAIFLTRYAKKVTVIAREPEFTCAKTIADKVLSHPNIDVMFHTEVEEVGGDTSLKYAKFINNLTGEKFEYHVEDEHSTFGIFVFAGYVPASDLVKGHVELNDQGYLITDENLETNKKGVYAAGDICVKNLRQVVTAVSDGALSATNLEKYVEAMNVKHNITREKPIDSQENSFMSSKEDSPDYNHYENTDNQHELNEDVFITEEMREKLLPIFSRFEKKVKVIAILDDTKNISKEVESFAQELSTLSDKVLVEIAGKEQKEALLSSNSISLTPALGLFNEQNEYLGVSFHGVPGGHEFNSFIIALYNAAGPGQTIDNSVLEKIKNLDKKVDIKIAISLSCTMCPDVVMGAQRIALENKNVNAHMLDLAHFEEIKRKYSIMSVPCMIINDTDVIFGKKSIEEIYNAIA